MKKMKKVLALLLAATLAGSALSGCGTNQEVENSDSVNSEVAGGVETEVSGTDELVPEEGASLILWMDNDEYNEQIVKLWNEKYPDIPLTVENVGTTDARTKLE